MRFKALGLAIATCCLWIASWVISPAVLTLTQRRLFNLNYDACHVEIMEQCRPITTLDLLQIRDVTGVNISPDGKWVAYRVHQARLETNDYEIGWYAVGTALGSTPVKIGDGGKPHIEDGFWVETFSSWSPDSAWLVYPVKQGSEVQLWRSRYDGSVTEQLTHNAQHVRSVQWSSDGQRIFFTVRPTQPSLYQLPKPSIGRGVLFTDESRAWLGVAGISPSEPSQESEEWVYDLSTRQERPATAAEQEQQSAEPPVLPDIPGLSEPRLSPDQKTLAYAATDPKNDERTALFVRPVGGGRATRLTFSSFGLGIYSHEAGVYTGNFFRGIWWGRDGQTIYFTQLTKDFRRALFAVSAKGGAVRQVSRSSGTLSELVFDASGTRVACLEESPTSPLNVVVFDLEDGVPRRLSDLNPEFRGIELGQVRLITATNKYGDKTWAHVVLPPNAVPRKRYPLVVTTYTSREFLRGGTGDEYPIHVFATNDFVVLSLERPRGYGDAEPAEPQGIEPVIKDVEGPVSTIEVMIKQLVKEGLVDPKRVAITGLSNGSTIANYAIAHTDLFRAAAVSGAGDFDSLWYFLQSSWWRDYLEASGLGGLPNGSNANNLRRIGQSVNAARVAAPLLIHASETEFLFALEFYQTLKELRKPAELFVYPEEDHFKLQPKHRYEIYNRNMDWMNFWLQDRQDLDPTKREQYYRWNAMKRKWK